MRYALAGLILAVGLAGGVFALCACTTIWGTGCAGPCGIFGEPIGCVCR